MKFLWRLKQDIKSNKLSSLLIAPELAFAMVCLAVCISLSSSFISSVIYFSRDFNNNSAMVYFNRDAVSPLEDMLSCDSVEKAMSVQYYSCLKENGDTLYIGNYSASAFNDFGIPCKGEMVDTSADYGNAVPCMVSKDLADEFPIGKTFILGDTEFYVAGSLTDDRLYWMTSYMTGDSFIMCYDTKGILDKKATEEKMHLSMSFCGFAAGKDGVMYDELQDELNQLDSVKETLPFMWEEKMSDDFDQMSGNLISGALILILSAFGFLSNIILGVRDNERSYACQIYFGQSPGGIIRVTAARICLLLVIAAAAAVTFLIKTSPGGDSGISLTHIAEAVIIISAAAMLSTISAGSRKSDKMLSRENRKKA